MGYFLNCSCACSSLLCPIRTEFMHQKKRQRERKGNPNLTRKLRRDKKLMNELRAVPLIDADKMGLKSQASRAIVPGITCSSDLAQGLATHSNDIAMQANEMDEHDHEQLSGFIFMCNGRTKPQCYKYHVFGLPVGKLQVVEKIKPGMKLFLFDFELKLLYGIYEATSVGTLHLEQTAFNGRFPAQVRFKIYRDCLPLHDSSFRHAIEYNYEQGFKFKQELNKQQVESLLSLFRPLRLPAPGSLQPLLLQAMQNQSGLPFPKDSCAQVLESQKVQQTGFQQGMGYVQPVDPNVTGLQLSHVQPVSEPQSILQSVPSPQQHYFGSTTKIGHSHPTMVARILPTSKYQYYLAGVQQLYAAGNPTQIVPDQYHSYGTMGVNQQLGTGNMYQVPLQREGETVQQQESVIQYYNSNASSAAPHITPSVLSYMPTMGVPEVAGRTLPLAYLYPFAGEATTHH